MKRKMFVIKITFKFFFRAKKFVINQKFSRSRFDSTAELYDICKGKNNTRWLPV